MTENSGIHRYKTGLAVAAVVIAVLALSFGDAVIKATGVSLPLWQMYILRSGLALPVLVVILAKRNSGKLGSVFWVAIRSSLLVLMWLCYYSALPLMPLSLAAAAYYTSPIFIIILAAILLRKVPSLRIWVAIFLGFGGVMLILRPDTSGFQLVTLLPVLAAFLYASAMVLTSAKCRNDDPIVLAIALNIAFIAGGAALGFWSGKQGSFMFGPWAPLDMKLISVIAILAGVIVIGGVGAAIAYQNGPPATIAAFDYTYLVFSLIWGAIFFAEFPGWISLSGIFVIVVAGLLALPKKDTEKKPLLAF